MLGCLLLLLLIVLTLLLVCFVVSDRKGCRPLRDLTGYHVLITGGSKGIGRALAVEAVLRRADVTIVSKNVDNLRNATDMLRGIRRSNDQRVQWYSHDLANNWQDIGQLVRRIQMEVGHIDILINNVGGAVQDPILDIGDDQFLAQMRLNYVTAACTTKHVLIGMHADGDRLRQRGGRLAFVSSQAGQVGLYGYSAYAPSKFALRGFAEAVQMEVRPWNVWVTVAYPPNTDTEGFVEEWKHTPAVTRRLTSGDGGAPWKPAAVAGPIMDSICRGRFDCHFGLEGWLLSTLCAGMSPCSDFLALVTQTLLMGIVRLVGLSYLKKFNFIVHKAGTASDGPKAATARFG